MEYFEFILSIVKQNRTKTPGTMYFEHHIFPRSLYPLLKNKKWNKVYLTSKEHAFAHYLLSKCTIGACQTRMIKVFEQYFNGTY